MNREIIRKIAANGFIAALYVAFTLACYPLAFDQIQFRLSEVLILLCFFRKDFIFGLTAGCAIANCFSSLGPIDIAFGTLATFIACLGICFSKRLSVAIIFPLLSNAFIVAWELWIVFQAPYFESVVFVGLGELCVMILGYILFAIICQNPKFHDILRSNQNREYRPNFANPIILSIAIGFAVLTIFFASSIASPIYQNFRSDQFDNDPQYFLYIGKLMSSGQKPYVDIYDHKGLYIFYYYYLVNFLGNNFLGAKSGLFILELFLYSTFYYFFIKTALELFDNRRKIALICTVFFFFIMTFVFQGGADLDLQLPLIGILLYLYVKGIKNKDFKTLMAGNIVAGLLAGLDINLRMSDAIVPFSCVCFYAYYAIKNKQYKYIVRDGLLCLSALGAMCIPPVIIAVSGGYFNEMFTALFSSNAGYVFSKRFVLNHSQISAYIMLLVALPILVLSLIFLRKKIDKDEWMFYLISAAVVYPFELLICLFPHYFLPLLPFLILYFARVFNSFGFVSSGESMVKHGDTIDYVKGNEKVHNIVLIASLVVSVFAMSLYPIYYYASGMYSKDKSIQEYIETTAGEKRDNLLVIDYGISFYLNSGFTTKTKYFSSQSWTISFEDDVMEEMERYITSGEIEYVVTRDYATMNSAYKKTVDDLLVKIPTLTLVDSTMKGNQYIDIYKLN